MWYKRRKHPAISHNMKQQSLIDTYISKNGPPRVKTSMLGENGNIHSTVKDMIIERRHKSLRVQARGVSAAGNNRM